MPGSAAKEAAIAIAEIYRLMFFIYVILLAADSLLYRIDFYSSKRIN
jgi:hypothetical protein